MANAHPSQAWLNEITNQLAEAKKRLNQIHSAGCYGRAVETHHEEIVRTLTVNYNKLLSEQYKALRPTPEQASIQSHLEIELQFKNNISKAEKEIADQLERQLKLMKEIKEFRIREAAEIAAVTHSGHAYR